MPNNQTANNAPNLSFQGIQVPSSALNPTEFFKRTRRQTVLQKSIGAIQGFGNTDVVDTLRSGILASYQVKINGNLVVTPGTGTVATTAKWPYGIIRAARFQANGQSNLINADGWHLRAREQMRQNDLCDRGVPQYIGGAYPGTQANQGTLSLASESWGVGSGVTAISAGTYDVELTFRVPVAYDGAKTLLGAVFCQTLSTTLELNLDWANLTDLFVLTGNAAVSFTPSCVVEAEMFTIPTDGQGGMYLPNLSAFHSFIQSKAPNNIAQGNNEITLAGQGVGRQLMAVLWRTQNGAVPASVAPIVPNATNITSPYWRYGTNTTPETWFDGQTMRYQNERDYNSDLAKYYGFQVIDFDRGFAFRDSVDEGSATEIRFGYTITTAPTLTTPYCEYSQDVVLAGAAA